MGKTILKGIVVNSSPNSLVGGAIIALIGKSSFAAASCLRSRYYFAMTKLSLMSFFFSFSFAINVYRDGTVEPTQDLIYVVQFSN